MEKLKIQQTKPVSKTYFVERQMFFAPAEIVKSNLTKKKASKLCKKLDKKELDAPYTFYTVGTID